ncbi:hypothetical protein PENSUB_13993, partial [Penicillium subrubescens]
MTTNHDTDASEEDSLMAQANGQLERELLQCQKPPFLTYRAPRCVVPLGISPATSKTGCQQMLFGNCTKIDAHDHLVGRYGEGLKLAVLVLSLDSYNVSITASGCNWRFDMHTDASVSCTVAPSQKTKSIEWTDPALDMASLRYHVAVVIGATRAKSSRPVALDAFVNWLRLTTMDIRGLTYPSGIISTPHGDLILDPQLRGQLYHNGITLTNSTVGGAFLFA